MRKTHLILLLALILAAIACQLPGTTSPNTTPPEPGGETLFDGITYTREVRTAPRAMVIHVIAVDLRGPPKCAEGEADGMELTVFPIGGPEGSFVRQEELVEYLAFNLTLKRLYAVYKITPGADALPYWPEGEYALLFEREVNDFPVPITAYIQDGKLFRLGFSVGESPEDIIQGLPVADILIAPQDIDSWLAP